MTFYERYQNGETTSVYADIIRLGQAAFTPEHYPDIEAVVTETMKRTAHNLNIIYEELQRRNYNFKRDIQYSFEAPVGKPLVNADELLIQLDEAVRPFGFVPLSLKLFYKIVGSCNFGWDYETNGDIPWTYADPICIYPLDSLLEEVTSKDWHEHIQEYVDSGDKPHLDLSADYYHKDHVSGGPAYALETTPAPGIDGKFLNEEHNTTFIDYLRIVFRNCGFGRTVNIENDKSFELCCDRVRPKLKEI